MCVRAQMLTASVDDDCIGAHGDEMAKHLLVVGTVFLSISFSAFMGACQTLPDPTVQRIDDDDELTVVSYNVNFGLAGDQSAIDVLALIDADVVLLQETNEGWERAIRRALGRRYPHMVFDHCCRAGGLATLSKHPIVERELLPAVNWFPAWRGVVKTPIGKISFLNVHLRPPFDDDGNVIKGYFTTRTMREDEIAAFTLAFEDNVPLIIAGDFNEANFQAVQFLRDRDMDDALDAVPGVPTWRWPVGPIEVTGRYDHIFFNANALALVDAHVVDAGTSDHVPVVAVLQTRR